MTFYNVESWLGERKVRGSISQLVALFSFFRYNLNPHTARNIWIIQLIAEMLDNKVYVC